MSRLETITRTPCLSDSSCLIFWKTSNLQNEFNDMLISEVKLLIASQFFFSPPPPPGVLAFLPFPPLNLQVPSPPFLLLNNLSLVRNLS